MTHKISYYKVTAATGGVETRWLGWQFLYGLQKQRWQAGFWLHQYVLRNTLAGSNRWFLCPGTLLYTYIYISYIDPQTDTYTCQNLSCVNYFNCPTLGISVTETPETTVYLNCHYATLPRELGTPMGGCPHFILLSESICHCRIFVSLFLNFWPTHSRRVRPT